MKQLPLWIFLNLILCFFPAALLALEDPGEDLQKVGLTTELGDQVDLSLTFQDSTGKTVTLQDFVQEGRPLILVPAYYNCPRLCGLLLSGVVDLLNRLKLTIGKDYQVVTVSFDTSEKPQLAAKRHKTYTDRFTGEGDAATGWRFLVGDKENVHPLMNQIGFHFKPDEGEFAHTAAIMLLTPDGKISQYFSDVTFPAWDVRLALVEASEGAIGSAIDHVYLFCFRFDPTKGRYTWAAFNVARAGAGIGLVLLAALLIGLWKRERLRNITPKDQ